MNTIQWTTEKPVLDRDCLLLVKAHLDEWHYNLFIIYKIEEKEGGYYWGIFYPDGDEWGDYSEFQSEWYAIIEL